MNRVFFLSVCVARISSCRHHWRVAFPVTFCTLFVNCSISAGKSMPSLQIGRHADVLHTICWCNLHHSDLPTWEVERTHYCMYPAERAVPCLSCTGSERCLLLFRNRVGERKSHCVPGISVQVFHLRAQQLAGPRDTVAVLISQVPFKLQCDACSVEVDTLMLQVQH